MVFEESAEVIRAAPTGRKGPNLQRKESMPNHAAIEAAGMEGETPPAPQAGRDGIPRGMRRAENAHR